MESKSKSKMKNMGNQPNFKQQSFPTQGQKPLLDIQMYEPSKPPRKRPMVNPSLYMPIQTAHPFLPPQYQGFGAGPYYHVPGVPKILKPYVINISGPVADHGKVNTVMEDILPSKEFTNTSLTLGERLSILEFVRSVFVRQHDGEDIDLEGTKDNSLLSYLKFMELNPYNTNEYTNNPYKSLPDDMLIYRSCYPIRYDKYTNSVNCAKNSVGMNVRIYRLSVSEYRIKKEEKLNYYDFDTWRELAYYEYIREQILKEMVCPNFPIIYAYFVCEHCNIDFDKIINIKGRQRNNNILSGGGDPNNILIPPPIEHFIQKRREIPYKNGEPIVKVELDGKQYSGKALVALTESPNYSIYGWSRKTYKEEGNIQRMVNTGYHKDFVWESVLFQLMAALYVLQIHKIAIENFDLANNVFIKDITLHGNVTKHWKYIVDGYEYYIPNYGYLVMVDSNFRDITPNNYSISRRGGGRKFKIISNIYEHDGDKAYDDESIEKLCFNGFKKCFSPNSFSNYFGNTGGTKPPEKIIRLIDDINKDIVKNNIIDIGYYIKTFMRQFLNNRIGTYLRDNEIKNIRFDEYQKLKSGEIVVQKIHNDTFKFCLFEEEINGKAYILSKNDPRDKKIERMETSKSLLYVYSRYDNILQNFKPNNANLNENDLQEIYTINKN